MDSQTLSLKRNASFDADNIVCWISSLATRCYLGTGLLPVRRNIAMYFSLNSIAEYELHYPKIGRRQLSQGNFKAPVLVKNNIVMKWNNFETILWNYILYISIHLGTSKTEKHSHQYMESPQCGTFSQIYNEFSNWWIGKRDSSRNGKRKILYSVNQTQRSRKILLVIELEWKQRSIVPSIIFNSSMMSWRIRFLWRWLSGIQFLVSWCRFAYIASQTTLSVYCAMRWGKLSDLIHWTKRTE